MKKTILTLILSILIFSNCTRIDSGQEAVKVNDYGDDKGDALPIPVRGRVWYNPFTQSVYEYPTFLMHKQYASFDITAKGGSIFTVSPTLNYYMIKGRAVSVFSTYRKDIEDIEEENIFASIYDSYVRVGNRFTSDSLLSYRGIFEDEVIKELNSKIGKDFFIKQIVSNMTPPQSLTDAINNKNKLIQEAMAEQTKVIKARASADVAIEDARGRSESKILEANAQSISNKKSQENLSPMLIELYKIQKWDGKTYSFGNQVVTVSK
jgi:regulator of protease activity HflC (stomatin/prohibitin superfamily)